MPLWLIVFQSESAWRGTPQRIRQGRLSNSCIYENICTMCKVEKKVNYVRTIPCLYGHLLKLLDIRCYRQVIDATTDVIIGAAIVETKTVDFDAGPEGEA